MENVELKARCADLDAAEAVAQRLVGPHPKARLHQTDTYFGCGEGRLKLREVTGTRSFAELISYSRPDEPGPKGSDYQIAPITGFAEELKYALTAALGVRAIVNKQRTVYIYDQTRIHLDRVDGLGDFIEFEAVLSEGQTEEAGYAVVRRLMTEFGIGQDDLIDRSYVDLKEEAAD